MKKHIKALSLLLTICCLASLLLQPLPASAATNIVSEETIKEEDGYTVITTIEEIPENEPYATTHTKKAQKVYCHYNTNDKLCWAYTLNGVFEYDGNLVVCISVSSTVDIYRTAWSLYSEDCDRERNRAYGKAVFKLKPSGVKKPAPLEITCNKLGTIS